MLPISNRRKWKYMIYYCLLIIATIIFVFPMVLATMYSFKPVEYSFLDFRWLKKLSVEHYITLLHGAHPYLGSVWSTRYIWNSLAVTLISVILACILGIPAAYTLARSKSKKSENLLFFFLSLRIIPPAAIIVPLYIATLRFHLLDTLPGLIFPYIIFNLSIIIYVMGYFFKEIPEEYEEAAMIDGCNKLSAFFRIALPLAMPGFFAVAILCFLFSWSEFILALCLTGPHARTLPVGVTEFLTPYGIQWELMFASSLFIFLLPLIFIVTTHRYLGKGLAILTGVKK